MVKQVILVLVQEQMGLFRYDGNGNELLFISGNWESDGTSYFEVKMGLELKKFLRIEKFQFSLIQLLIKHSVH